MTPRGARCWGQKKCNAMSCKHQDVHAACTFRESSEELMGSYSMLSQVVARSSASVLSKSRLCEASHGAPQPCVYIPTFRAIMP
mmetsp:Transcript_11269/g.30329  ORF Transcript_11269/g.30329 Transcript_11269/m.30329 type:complete len:84 (+) Transcript_11269:509-760(+)